MDGNVNNFVSITLFFLSALLFKNTVKTEKVRYFYGTLALCYLFSFSFYLIADYFTGEGINEATIYHIKYGLQGAGFLEYLDVIIAGLSLVVLCVLLPVYLVKGRVSSNVTAISKIKGRVAFILVLVAQILNPAVGDAYSLIAARLPTEESGYLFRDYYAQEKPRAKTTGQRNFVFLYLESLERTYFDERLFPGLIKNLKRLEGEGLSFTQIGQFGNSGWTIAGMVASQCGTPLFSTLGGNAMSGVDRFLPGAYCLGDLLHDEGYQLTFYGGAPNNFAGKGTFLSTHGFTEVNGKKELVPKLSDPDYTSFWGIYDDTLLDLAYQRYLDLSGSPDRFGLFLLTLDTHHPDGHPSSRCEGQVYGDGTNPILNAVSCSDELVGAFVDKIRMSPYGKETVIIIASDHLAMKNSASSQLIQGDRKNLFMILDPQNESSGLISKEGSTYDVSSTILPFIGFQGDLGLGIDLLGDKPSLRTVFDRFEKQLTAWQGAMEKFWEFPKISQYIEVVSPETVRIDDRTFGLPILLEVNSDLETVLRFEFNLSSSHQNLKDHIYSLGSASAFIWIDSCDKINSLAGKEMEEGTCLAVGRLNDSGTKRLFKGETIKVNIPQQVSAEEIREVLFN